ncbi:PDIA4 [Cordylochernes scorpioides]|uniref:PDIA4 n=1 Tax=Cordylochernes scorpioides TaxID=51811 RepID=A0ABY6LJG7_9ARAC|nr:PDIA4 [Cordylochernes scorpioides]
MQEFLSTTKLSLVMFYSPKCEHCKLLMPTFEKAALTLKTEGISLAKVDGTVEDKLATKYNVTAWPTLLVFRKEKPYKYRGGREHDEWYHRGICQELGNKTKEDILNFWDKHALPLVGHRTQNTTWLYRNRYPLLVVYFSVDFSHAHRTDTQIIRGKVVEVAKKYPKITFAIADETEYAEELRSLDLDDSGEDVNAAYFKGPKERYRMEPTDEDLAESLQTFVKDIQSGQLTQHFKSQLTPKNNEGSVVIVVGQTFEKLVYSSKKDTLLEFYAPWCGPCRDLEPTYNKVAKAFAQNPNFQVAKIDADSNDYPPEFNIRGFPQIFYVPGRSKSRSIVEFSGNRTYENLVQFVQDQLGSRKQEL